MKIFRATPPYAYQVAGDAFDDRVSFDQSGVLRYIRRGRTRKIELVAEARAAKRAADGDGT